MILIAGSVNQDLIITTPHFPRLGETIAGSGFTTAAGGKGANQAVAAARLGGRVIFAACVGDDETGQRMINNFRREAIDISHIKSIKNTPTGTAVITLCGGDNFIILDPGANRFLTPDSIKDAEKILPDVRILLTQMEIPMETVEYVIGSARRHGVFSILNPAPAVRLKDELYKQIDLITPNETEASILTGMDVVSIESAEKAIRVFLQKGAGQVIITLGESGAVYNEGSNFYHAPAYPVSKATDTTAAGDCFSAAIAVALTEGKNIHEAIQFAGAAAALAVTRLGAQPSLPTRDEVIHFLNVI